MAGLQVTVTPDPSTSPFQQGAAGDEWQDGSRTPAGATQPCALPTGAAVDNKPCALPTGAAAHRDKEASTALPVQP